jgi:hypothetical protein
MDTPLNADDDDARPPEAAPPPSPFVFVFFPDGPGDPDGPGRRRFGAIDRRRLKDD